MKKLVVRYRSFLILLAVLATTALFRPDVGASLHEYRWNPPGCRRYGSFAARGGKG